MALLLRSFFLLTVLASLFVRLHGLRNRDEIVATFDVDTAIRDIILDHGFPLRENPVKPPKVLSRAIYFQRPECSRPSLVMPYALSSEVLLYLDQAIEPSFERRFIYLDKSWEAQNRFAMYFEWSKNVFLGGFGKPRYFAERTALLVAEPSDCNRSDAIDWQLVWNRERKPVALGAKRADFGDQGPGLAMGSS